jgi:TatD DNase family protein
MVDSHAHLNHPAIRNDIKAVLERAVRQGVQAIINVGYDLSSSEVAVEQATNFNGFVWASVGIHPHNATSLTKEALARLRELASKDVVVAVGEIGLDFYRNLSPEHEQLKAFEAQLELACEVKKPVVIHMRNSASQVVSVMNNYRGLLKGFVAHCFSGDEALVAEFVELGFHIGMAGNITFKSSNELRRVVRSIPLDRLLTETDSPYLAPVPHRGKRNEPAYLVYVVEAIATALGMPSEDVADVTARNAISLFNLPSGHRSEADGAKQAN